MSFVFSEVCTTVDGRCGQVSRVQRLLLWIPAPPLEVSTVLSSPLFHFQRLFSKLLPSSDLAVRCSKGCVTCGCSGVDHAPGGDAEDDQQMGRLLAGSPCSHLTTKVKGGGGLRTYKRNRMIVTNPVVSRKDPTFNTTTYDWAPAGLNQTLVSGARRQPRRGIYHRGAKTSPEGGGAEGVGLRSRLSLESDSNTFQCPSMSEHTRIHVHTGHSGSSMRSSLVLNSSPSRQAMQFMQLIPECQRPVSGTAGALQRRRKLLVQLPVYDQDPMKCQSLTSEEEVLCLF